MGDDPVPMDFQAAVDALRALAGKPVIVVVQTPEWHSSSRPYVGDLLAWA
jgi:hypothetical protein